jgi:hypothetical protein
MVPGDEDTTAKDTSSTSGGQAADLNPPSGFEQPKGQTGLEKDGIAEAMDETMARVDTDVKAVDSLNEYDPVPEQQQASSILPSPLMDEIKMCLRNGMDSQQQINAYEQIESALLRYIIRPRP